eukprot:6571788-Prymnesium_polylepis.1
MAEGAEQPPGPPLDESGFMMLPFFGQEVGELFSAPAACCSTALHVVSRNGTGSHLPFRSTRCRQPGAQSDGAVQQQHPRESRHSGHGHCLS